MVPCTWPKYVTSVARRNSSGSISQNGAKIVAIAAFTQAAIGPSSLGARRGVFDLAGVGDVRGQREPAAAERLGLPARARETVVAAGDECHVRAASSQLLDDGSPDTGRRAGDDAHGARNDADTHGAEVPARRLETAKRRRPGARRRRPGAR